jgi:hypothetical protein
VLLVCVLVHAVYNFIRFSILATLTLSRFHAINACTACIFMTTTCRDIVCVIVSYLHELSLHCVPCTRDFSKISKVGILNSCALRVPFAYRMRNF